MLSVGDIHIHYHGVYGDVRCMHCEMHTALLPGKVYVLVTWIHRGRDVQAPSNYFFFLFLLYYTLHTSTGKGVVTYHTCIKCMD